MAPCVSRRPSAMLRHFRVTTEVVDRQIDREEETASAMKFPAIIGHRAISHAEVMGIAALHHSYKPRHPTRRRALTPLAPEISLPAITACVRLSTRVFAGSPRHAP